MDFGLYFDISGSKRFKINKKKGGSIWSKLLEKIDTKCLKSVQYYILVKIRPSLGPNISGTKCDRDKPIIFAEREVNRIVLRDKIGTQSDWKPPKWGHHCGTSLPCPSMGVPEGVGGGGGTFLDNAYIYA